MLSSASLHSAAASSRSTRLLSSETASPKPPNILIYQPDKDTTSVEFLRAKESLQSCLTPERYVLYPLGVDDILHYSPWKDNCRLVVVPPATKHAQWIPLPSRVMEEVVSYVQRGGRLLCMHAHLSKILKLKPFGEVSTLKDAGRYCQDGVCSVQVQTGDHIDVMGMEQGLRFSGLVPESDLICSQSSDDLYFNGDGGLSICSSSDLAFLVPLERNTDLQWNGTNTNNSNNVTDQSNQSSKSCDHAHDQSGISCVRRVTFTAGGVAVLCNVDLLPNLHSDLQVSALLQLKRDVTSRRSFLTSLLQSLELECSEERLPELSHTYLLASQEVRPTGASKKW